VSFLQESSVKYLNDNQNSTTKQNKMLPVTPDYTNMDQRNQAADGFRLEMNKWKKTINFNSTNSSSLVSVILLIISLLELSLHFYFKDHSTKAEVVQKRSFFVIEN
jgi:hypothetical protein